MVHNSVRGDVQRRKLYRVVAVDSMDPGRQAEQPAAGGDRLKLHKCLVEARFIRRLNRFAALMEYRGARVQVHVANSGRLAELLSDENRMFLTPVGSRAGRKTAFDLTLVEVKGVLVSADARAPNALLQEAIESGQLRELAGYDTLAREVRFLDSRLDMMLTRPDGTCYVEAKSVTLVENGTARFPDAPTERGRKHVGSLSRAVADGHRGAIVFVVQRPDAVNLQPNRDADPAFCAALDAAASSGVEVYAYRCQVSLTDIRMSESIPVLLG
jgi:sugar fermentation stimulation protein A